MLGRKKHKEETKAKHEEPEPPVAADPGPEPYRVHIAYSLSDAELNAQYLAAARHEESLHAKSVDERLKLQEKAQAEERRIKAGGTPAPEAKAPAYPETLTPLQKLHKELMAAVRWPTTTQHVKAAKALAEQILEGKS